MHDEDPTAAEPHPIPPVPEMTGHADVDEVLGSLQSLERLAVADHVEVFDQAHEGLRRALADAAAGEATGVGREQPPSGT